MKISDTSFFRTTYPNFTNPSIFGEKIRTSFLKEIYENSLFLLIPKESGFQLWKHSWQFIITATNISLLMKFSHIPMMKMIYFSSNKSHGKAKVK